MSINQLGKEKSKSTIFEGADMLKKIVITVVGLMVGFCLTVYGADPRITMNVKYEDCYEYSTLTCKNQTNGSIMWSKTLDALPATELTRSQYLGINNGYAYVLHGGTILLLDPETGAVKKENSDFGGASASWIFSSSGKLYMCGYYGPDFYVIDKDGKTVSRIESINDKYYWPESMIFTKGNDLILTYGAKDGAGEGSYPVEFDVTKYFGTVEK